MSGSGGLLTYRIREPVPRAVLRRSGAPKNLRSVYFPRSRGSQPEVIRRRCHHHHPPRVASFSGGDVEDVVRFALIETLVARRASRSCRGRGWGGVFQTSSCTSVRGNACMLPQHVQCESARRATATGAPYPQARPIPRTLSACSAQSPLMIGVMTIVMKIVTSSGQASRAGVSIRCLSSHLAKGCCLGLGAYVTRIKRSGCGGAPRRLALHMLR